MTIDDKIEDEQLQYDINREAAKISALSPGKIDKYQYLTGDEILPSNQKQITEQAKFTYSPLGKAFKKQTKIIQDQGQKQVDALNTLKLFRDNKPDDNENLLKYKEMFEELSNKRIYETQNMSKQIDFKNLVYYFTALINLTPINFIIFKGPMHISNDIKNGETSVEKVEEDQKQFKSDLNQKTT